MLALHCVLAITSPFTDVDTFQILSRAKPALGANTGPQVTAATNKKALPKLEDFLSKRDFTGAITLLEVNLSHY